MGLHLYIEACAQANSLSYTLGISRGKVQKLSSTNHSKSDGPQRLLQFIGLIRLSHLSMPLPKWGRLNNPFRGSPSSRCPVFKYTMCAVVQGSPTDRSSMLCMGEHLLYSPLTHLLSSCERVLLDLLPKGPLH